VTVSAGYSSGYPAARFQKFESGTALITMGIGHVIRNDSHLAKEIVQGYVIGRSF